MTAGQKLFELNNKMEEVLSDAAAVQAKIDSKDKHLVVKVIASLFAVAGTIVSFTLWMTGGPYAIYWAVLGFVFLIVNLFNFAKAIDEPFKYASIARRFSERFDAAQTEYRRALEDEAEAHGIDPGTVKSRERKNEENTSFLASRNGIPVSLIVEKQDDTMVIKENGRLLNEMQTA